MIVLSTSQYNFLMDFKAPFQELLQLRFVDFVPVKIQTLDEQGLPSYILPENLLFDDNFKEIKQALEEGGHLNNITIRDIYESEIISSGLN